MKRCQAIVGLLLLCWSLPAAVTPDAHMRQLWQQAVTAIDSGNELDLRRIVGDETWLLHWRGPDGEPLLHRAAQQNPAMARQLILRGADLWRPDVHGQTLAHKLSPPAYAELNQSVTAYVQRRWRRRIDELSADSIDGDDNDDKRASVNAAFVAVMRNDLAGFRVIMQTDRDSRRRLLAARGPAGATVVHFIYGLGDARWCDDIPLSTRLLRQRDASRRNPLIWAVQAHRYATTMDSLRRFANTRMYQGQLENALMWATDSLDIDIVHAVLERGILDTPRAAAIAGNTIDRILREHDLPAVLAPFLANVSSHDLLSRSWPALHQAVRFERPRSLKLILAKGFPINARNNFGQTALHIAAHRGDATSITVLLAGRSRCVSP